MSIDQGLSMHSNSSKLTMNRFKQVSPQGEGADEIDNLAWSYLESIMGFTIKKAKAYPNKNLTMIKSKGGNRTHQMVLTLAALPIQFGWVTLSNKLIMDEG